MATVRRWLKRLRLWRIRSFGTETISVYARRPGSFWVWRGDIPNLLDVEVKDGQISTDGHYWAGTSDHTWMLEHQARRGNDFTQAAAR